jgi:hypothetical protein
MERERKERRKEEGRSERREVGREGKVIRQSQKVPLLPLPGD